jgi:hypothetical protein
MPISRFLDRYKVTVGRVCNNVSEMLILVRRELSDGVSGCLTHSQR